MKSQPLISHLRMVEPARIVPDRKQNVFMEVESMPNAEGILRAHLRYHKLLY